MTTSSVRHLCTLFNQLTPTDQQSVLAFVEFLHQRTPVIHLSPPPEPELLPRPEQESVIAAIKRLSKSYPMLDKAKMLDETSSLMTEHLLHGRDRAMVIDELEGVFLRHYQVFIENT